jgi:hypothetical protein
VHGASIGGGGSSALAPPPHSAVRGGGGGGGRAAAGQRPQLRRQVRGDAEPSRPTPYGCSAWHMAITAHHEGSALAEILMSSWEGLADIPLRFHNFTACACGDSCRAQAPSRGVVDDGTKGGLGDTTFPAAGASQWWFAWAGLVVNPDPVASRACAPEPTEISLPFHIFAIPSCGGDGCAPLGRGCAATGHEHARRLRDQPRRPDLLGRRRGLGGR